MLYAFVYDQRMPHVLEIAALVLLLAGVYGSVRQHGDTPAGGNTSGGTPAKANAAAH